MQSTYGLALHLLFYALLYDVFVDFADTSCLSSPFFFFYIVIARLSDFNAFSTFLPRINIICYC